MVLPQPVDAILTPKKAMHITISLHTFGYVKGIILPNKSLNIGIFCLMGDATAMSVIAHR